MFSMDNRGLSSLVSWKVGVGEHWLCVWLHWSGRALTVCVVTLEWESIDCVCGYIGLHGYLLSAIFRCTSFWEVFWPMWCRLRCGGLQKTEPPSSHISSIAMIDHAAALTGCMPRWYCVICSSSLSLFLSSFLLNFFVHIWECLWVFGDGRRFLWSSWTRG